MKINKSKSPFAAGADSLDDKEPLKSVRGAKFAEALESLGNAAETAEPDATRSAFAAIAQEYDLSDENGRRRALQKSSEFLIKARLSEENQNKEKIVEDLSHYISDDPLLKNKLLSVLQKLRAS